MNFSTGQVRARLKSSLKTIPGLVSVVQLLKWLFSQQHRSTLRLQQNQSTGLFQPSSHTRPDRYPLIFSFVRSHLGTIPAPRLMSFGCSSGEEVFSLRRYFPTGEITGIDINPHNIRICRGKLLRSRETGIRFELAATPTAEPTATYDAVFCMAVLRHGELEAVRPPRCDHLIRFANFEDLVTDLARCLKPGGYLVIRHSNFRFSDTTVAAKFETILSIPPKPGRERTPLYGPDDRLLVQVVYDDAVFRKQAAT